LQGLLLVARLCQAKKRNDQVSEGTSRKSPLSSLESRRANIGFAIESDCVLAVWESVLVCAGLQGGVIMCVYA
jgi:hypothetical protein